MKPPVAKTIPHKITQHGYERVDNYAWLRDDNWRAITAGDVEFKNPEILKYLEDENSYTDEMMKDTEALQKELYEDILSHVKEDDESFPMKYGPYMYYSRTEKGLDYPILCRKKKEEGSAEDIYFDVNKEAANHELYMMGSQSISPDHRYMGYTFNLSGSMAYTVSVRDTETGKDLGWTIPEVSGPVVWAKDSKHLYYGHRHPELGRTYQIYQVNIEEGPSSKKLIFEKPEEHSDKFMSVYKSNSGEYLFVYMADAKTSSTYFWKSDAVENVNPQLFTEVEEGVLYTPEHHDQDFYIVTNKDGATNFKVVKTPVTQTAASNWVSYIEESKDTYIENAHPYKGYLVLSVQNNAAALPGIIVRDLAKEKETQIVMPQEAYDLTFVGSRDYETNELRFFYESPTQPSQTIDYMISTGEQVIRKTKEVPNYSADEFEVKREFAEAADGALIPVTVSYKKGLEKNGRNKTLLIGYGSYGYSYPTYFSPKWIALWNRGYAIAIAHIRGGADKGYQWYLDGKMDKKKNSFTDFNTCAEHLIKSGYTCSEHLAANGGSAGGLLMAAITNLRPDLYKVVVADVAFVDVINTISDETLPLTPPEWEEWGNPIKNKEEYEYIASYSPYDNIEEKDYPIMLYTSGVSDEQVTYWEPTKMVAKLRAMKTDDNPLLLKMKMASGHAGASKRYAAIEETAFKFAFILKYLG